MRGRGKREKGKSNVKLLQAETDGKSMCGNTYHICGAANNQLYYVLAAVLSSAKDNTCGPGK
jgi:hypothetical protein